MKIRAYQTADLPAMTEIWNQVVEEGQAFPQEDTLNLQEAEEFFAGQSFTGVAEEDGEILGLYILHPNNVGRCGHISNASYAVRSDIRGRHIGESLVKHCMEQGKQLGFHVLQFNAVVCTNLGAIHLYDKLGFTQVGKIPGGFKQKNGTYEDIFIYYHLL